MKRIFLSFILLICSSIAIFADSTITIYTKCGKSIEGIIRSELCEQEISEINSYYQTTFPNAVFLASATSTYNCHSYAWNMQEGGTTCWINATISTTNDNLSKYWFGDYFVETVAANADKIFYYESDHSAVVSSVAGMYESKWGSAPLMRHAPDYGPYNNMCCRHYYYHHIYYGTLACSTGTGETSVGVSSTYSPNINSSSIPYGSNVVYNWAVYDAKGDDVEGTKANLVVLSPGSSATISFNNPGLYDVYCTIKLLNGELLGSFYFQPVVSI